MLTGRGFGKGFRADGAYQDEVSAQTMQVWARQKEQRLERRRDRQDVELYRRRYEFPTGVRTGGATAPVACPHLRRVWWQEPHPRYGDAVPHFRSALRRVKATHTCVPGATA